MIKLLLPPNFSNGINCSKTAKENSYYAVNRVCSKALQIKEGSIYLASLQSSFLGTDILKLSHSHACRGPHPAMAATNSIISTFSGSFLVVGSSVTGYISLSTYFITS